MDNFSNMEDYSAYFGEGFLPGGGSFHSDWEKGLWTETTHEPINNEENPQCTENYQDTPLLMNQDPLLAMDPKLLNSVIPSSFDGEGVEGFQQQEITVSVEVSNQSIPVNGQWTVIAEGTYDSSTPALNNYDDTTSFTNTSFDSGYEDQTYQGWSYESLRDPASKYVPETLNLTNSFDNALMDDYLPVSEDVTLPNSVNNAKKRKTKTGVTSTGEPKRKVGRPKKTYSDITVVPTKASPKTIEQAKQKRNRELNNIASQKCRAKIKQRRIDEEREAEDLQRKINQMKSEVESLENAIKRMKQKFKQANLQIPDFPFCSTY